MNKIGILSINILIISILLSCTSSTAKRAEANFRQVDALVAANDRATALQLLDSMTVNFKDDYRVLGEALRRSKTIGLEYHRGIVTDNEKQLTALEPRITALARNFILTPGAAGMPGIYEHRRQTVETSWNRTYLKITVNEDGDAWLTTHYYGDSWIDHTSVRIYDQENYIVTDTIGLGHEWNRKVEDGGDKWETIDFREGSDAGAIAFIADNWNKSLKAKFSGKKFYYIVLESYDKEAFRDGWQLAQLLKERSNLRRSAELHRSELAKLGVTEGR